MSDLKKKVNYSKRDKKSYCTKLHIQHYSGDTMGYAKLLKNLFPGMTLSVEDLFFLEAFQIKYLPGRVLKQEFAVLVKAHPIIHRYLITKCPSMSDFINDILKTDPINNNKTTEECCIDLLWEIADLIIYNKYPELYDKNVEFVWSIDEIISKDLLKGKIALDVGAGSGKLAFQIAQYAKTVYAVDGFLDAIPFPNNSVDILMTSQAIGWNLKKELHEIERVLKPKGRAIHLFHTVQRSLFCPVQPCNNFPLTHMYGYHGKEYKHLSPGLWFLV